MRPHPYDRAVGNGRNEKRIRRDPGTSPGGHGRGARGGASGARSLGTACGRTQRTPGVLLNNNSASPAGGGGAGVCRTGTGVHLRGREAEGRFHERLQQRLGSGFKSQAGGY